MSTNNCPLQDFLSDSGISKNIDHFARNCRNHLDGLLSEGGILNMPKMNIYETESRVHYEVELPGMIKSDIKLEEKDGNLVIEGERKKKFERYNHMEMNYGKVSRSLPLPPNADRDSIQAQFNDGILDITVGKLEVIPPSNKIDIN